MKISYKKNLFFWILLLFNILPIVIGFVFINLFAIDIPYHDQFDEEIPKILHYYDGTLKGTEFLSVNNDHRPIVVHVITFLLYKLTDINVVVEVNLGYMLHVIAFCILVALFKITFPDIHPLGLYILPVTWFFFNLYLISAYLWGILFSSSLCLVALFSMVYLIHRSMSLDWFFVFALTAAILGMFSWIAGLFLWPAGLIQIFLSNSREKNKKTAVWLFTAAAVIVANYIVLDFPSKGVHGFEGYTRYLIVLFQYPVHKAICFVEAVGSNIIHEVISALFFGFILLVLLGFIILIERKKVYRAENTPWFTISLYSMMIIFALVIGRSGDGEHFGPANNLFFLPAVRHFPSIFMFMIGLYGLILNLFIRDIHRDTFPAHNDKTNYLRLETIKSIVSCVIIGFIVAFLLSGYILHIRTGITNGVTWAEENNENWINLKNYRSIDDNDLNKLYINRQTANELERYNLSVFKGSPPGLYPRLLPYSLRQRFLLYSKKSI